MRPLLQEVLFYYTLFYVVFLPCILHALQKQHSHGSFFPPPPNNRKIVKYTKDYILKDIVAFAWTKPDHESW